MRTVVTTEPPRARRAVTRIGPAKPDDSDLRTSLAIVQTRVLLSIPKDQLNLKTGLVAAEETCQAQFKVVTVQENTLHQVQTSTAQRGPIIR